ncbi:hypothetical protein [Pontibacter burrus]|uniref:Uncharacterized protein n=1 Tax=Pontibacter burrus TaxID=2704466 RepID=A0A6B3LQB9_9BACT|nr:hypothetical protein [Pontibacter burrus]NEM96188.1 hypothetical protein [Pontibacter burrus]
MRTQQDTTHFHERIQVLRVVEADKEQQKLVQTVELLPEPEEVDPNQLDLFHDHGRA